MLAVVLAFVALAAIAMVFVSAAAPFVARRPALRRVVVVLGVHEGALLLFGVRVAIAAVLPLVDRRWRGTRCMRAVPTVPAAMLLLPARAEALAPARRRTRHP